MGKTAGHARELPVRRRHCGLLGTLTSKPGPTTSKPGLPPVTRSLLSCTWPSLWASQAPHSWTSSPHPALSHPVMMMHRGGHPHHHGPSHPAYAPLPASSP